MGRKRKKGYSGKKARPKGKGHLYVFIVSLCVVIITGLTAMTGIMIVTGNKKNTNGQQNRDNAVIDFIWSGNQQANASEQESGTEPESSAGETEDAGATASTELPSSPELPPQEEVDPITEENERLYNEAVAKGETVRIVECADKTHVTFAFAGDILLDDKYAMMYSYKARGSDINDTFTGGLLESMRSADVFMLNNEFPFSERGTPTEGKQFTFRASPANIELYAQMGVDVVSLANNHAYDHGEEALLDTFTTLENAGIPYVGAGRTIDDARKPVYFIANGIKVAIVSATQIERNSNPDTKEATATSPGVLRCLDPTALLQVIADAKANSDFVILYIHWGTESREETDQYQDRQALLYAEAGVDLIIGDHPHCLQKLDVVSGVPVVYSLGNFWFNSKTQNTCLVEVGIQKDGIEFLRFVPCRQENKRTIQLEGTDKIQLLNYMRGLSPRVQIDDDGYVTY